MESMKQRRVKFKDLRRGMSLGRWFNQGEWSCFARWKVLYVNFSDREALMEILSDQKVMSEKEINNIELWEIK